MVKQTSSLAFFLQAYLKHVVDKKHKDNLTKAKTKEGKPLFIKYLQTLPEAPKPVEKTYRSHAPEAAKSLSQTYRGHASGTTLVWLLRLAIICLDFQDFIIFSFIAIGYFMNAVCYIFSFLGSILFSKRKWVIFLASFTSLKLV